MSITTAYAASKIGLFKNERSDVLLVTNNQDTQLLYSMVFNGQNMPVRTVYPAQVLPCLNQYHHQLIVIEISSEKYLDHSFNLIQEIYQQASTIPAVVVLAFDVAICMEQLIARNIPIFGITSIPNFSNEHELKKLHGVINDWKKFLSFKPNQVTLDVESMPPVTNQRVTGNIHFS